MSRAMKDSGIPWIGEIPETWEVAYLKHFCKVNSGREIEIEASDTDAIPVFGSGGVFKYTNKAQFAGEAVMFGRKGTLGKPIYVNDSFWAVDTMYYLTFGNILNAKYCYYQLSAFNWEPYITQTALPSIVATDIVNTSFAFPPTEEQQAIADYLDEKCAEVDEMIALQEQIIEELKAYKQSVITEAVTKGLNPDVPMKDSGIEWIGEIPEHWNVHPFKAYYKTTKGLNITKENLVESGAPVISYGQIHSKLNTGTSISNELIRCVPETYLDSNPECLSKKFDMFFADTSEDREGAGNVAFIDIDTPIFAGYHTIIARPNDEIKTKYFAYLTKTDAWRTQIRNSVSGVKVFSISQKLINRAYIIIPSPTEQQAIADYLDDKCADIDSLIQTKQSKIDSLKEYKKSIIYEYVTGKREVK